MSQRYTGKQSSVGLGPSAGALRAAAILLLLGSVPVPAQTPTGSTDPSSPDSRRSRPSRSASGCRRREAKSVSRRRTRSTTRRTCSGRAPAKSRSNTRTSRSRRTAPVRLPDEDRDARRQRGHRPGSDAPVRKSRSVPRRGQDGRLENATANLAPDYHVVAQSIEKIGPATYRIEKGIFTSCDLPKPEWSSTCPRPTSRWTTTRG